MTVMERPRWFFTRPADFQRVWPFVEERLCARLAETGEVQVAKVERDQSVEQVADLGSITGIAWFGGRFTSDTLDAAFSLRVVGCNTDNTGHGLPLVELAARGIPVIDTTRAWGQSVAELALGLALAALRRIPIWHQEVASGAASFRYEAEQFCDARDFVNGELGTKRVGIIGLGQIGGRVARWCVALGADAATGPDLRGAVLGYDPFLAPSVAQEWGVRLVDMDTLVDQSEVVFVLVPPTPSATSLLSRERIARLQQGALVVIATRAHAVEMAALRERLLANELAAAFDVYDVEPLPLDDPLRGRANVVHRPHIAGRTRDANWRTADLLADDFARVVRGETPLHRLTATAIAARTGG
ncbi:MAG: NAD(P)-dependent oxidoreductase [Chloroflexota bacterium]